MTDHQRASVNKMLAEFRAIWAPLEPMYPTTGYDECDDGLHVAVSMAFNYGEYNAELNGQSWPHEHAIGAASKACIKWAMAYLRGTADEERDTRKIAMALVKKAARRYDEDKAAQEAANEE